MKNYENPSTSTTSPETCKNSKTKSTTNPASESEPGPPCKSQWPTNPRTKTSSTKTSNRASTRKNSTGTSSPGCPSPSGSKISPSSDPSSSSLPRPSTDVLARRSAWNPEQRSLRSGIFWSIRRICCVHCIRLRRTMWRCTRCWWIILRRSGGRLQRIKMRWCCCRESSMRWALRFSF